jgi:hypothetical protein
MPAKIDKALKDLKKEILKQQKEGEVTVILVQGSEGMKEDIEHLPPPN